MPNWGNISLKLHKKWKGKLAIASKAPLKTRFDLSTAYTPGVAQPCLEIAKRPAAAYEYTWKGNSVAVLSNGTRVLGLGNIGALAALPVMEGKAILFKQFANIDAVPICVDAKTVEEMVAVGKAIAPTFGGINLEDISVPNCFEIEDQLIKALDIPVFHDDQHGTAIVTLAALLNALKATQRDIRTAGIVCNGVGAAGSAILKMLYVAGARNIVAFDSTGALTTKRKDITGSYKKKLLPLVKNFNGDFVEGLESADVFIGTAGKANILTAEMVRSMNSDSVIIALSNPNPEIMPPLAYSAGAKIVCTGRSDFPNQANNVLVFPGVFRGALDARAKKITAKMKLAAAYALSGLENHS
ncbi:MAG: NADP-dependent malic enzyme, partial [Candidatus Micrarchaeota archaeon]|nr:NADP-dependent malic enzyme [Candidatus Micrarchaeota archaeon]